MTNLLPNLQDLKVLGSMLAEGQTAFGVPCWMMNPADVRIPDIGFEYDVVYDDNVKERISIVFDPHPTPKLLQNLGWMISHETSLLITIPRYIPKSITETRLVGDQQTETKPQRYSRLVIDYDYYDFGREFVITEISAPTFNPIFFYAKIAPYTINRSDYDPNLSQHGRSPEGRADGNIGRFLNLEEVNPEYGTVTSQFRFIRGLNPRSSKREGNL